MIAEIIRVWYSCKVGGQPGIGEAEFGHLHLISLKSFINPPDKIPGIVHNRFGFLCSYFGFDVIICGFPSLFRMGQHPAIHIFNESGFNKFKPKLENQTLVTPGVDITAR